MFHSMDGKSCLKVGFHQVFDKRALQTRAECRIGPNLPVPGAGFHCWSETGAYYRSIVSSNAGIDIRR
jgi:hypothetical protein